MKIGKYNIPTSVALGGGIGVAVLVAGRYLQGGSTEPPAPAAAAPPQTDEWGDAVGQFPSFPTPGTSPDSGYDWWDPEAPPPPPPPINPPPAPGPTPTPTTSPLCWPGGPARPSGANRWARISSTHFRLWTYSGGIYKPGTYGSLAFSAWMSGNIAGKTATGSGTFAKILTGTHAGRFVHISDAGITWHTCAAGTR